MLQINQKGAILPALMVLLLAAGVAVGTYLTQTKTNLFPKASGYSIRGVVFHDCNRNGVKDANEKVADKALVEYGTFFPYNKEGVKQTDSNGAYGFTASDKDFTLIVADSDFRWMETPTVDFRLRMDVAEKVVNIGLVPRYSDLECNQNGEIDTLARIGPSPNWPNDSRSQDTNGGGFVWLDLNKNGQKDPREIELPGIKINLQDRTGTRILNTVYTSAYFPFYSGSSSYGFKLTPLTDTYRYQVEVPEGYVKTTSDSLEMTCREVANSYPIGDSRMWIICNPEQANFGIAPDNNYVPPVPVSSTIVLTTIEPLSCNGKYPQIQVKFQSNTGHKKYEIWRKVDGVTSWQVAKEVYEDGTYTDDRIDSNTYRRTAFYLVRGEDSSGRKDSETKQVTVPSCGNPVSPTPTPTPTPTPSSTATPQPSASVTGTGTLTVKGTVYRDFNGNGVLDSGDKEYADSPVYLHNPDGSKVLAQFRTTVGGNFAFYNLAPGTYRITHYVPPGYSKTTDDSFSFELYSDKTVYFGIKPN